MAIRAIPSQKWRAFFLLIYLAALAIASKLALDAWFPPASGGKAVWFYTGLASLLLGNHLVTPYFSKPVDAISYAVAAAAALYGSEELGKWGEIEKVLFIFAIGYCLLVILFAFLAIFTRNSKNLILQNTSRTSTLLAEGFGNHRAVFGITIFVAVYLFHRDSVEETFLITLACVIVVVARPDEVLTGLISRINEIWKNSFSPKTFGEVAAIQIPCVYLIRHAEDQPIKFGASLALKTSGRNPFPVVALDHVGRDESHLLRCVETDDFSSSAHKVTAASFRDMLDDAAVILALEPDDQNQLIDPVLNKFCERLVGLVAPDTSNDRLYFEVVTVQELQQGLLVEVAIQGKQVIYQLLDGLTKEEIVYQKNTFGYVRAQAKKIGIWDATQQKFSPSKWLPAPNTPIFLVKQDQNANDENVIGHFPGGAHPVKLANIDHLVTHNTAILGILGVGKSMLAIELVERMMARRIKVVCLDLTDEYAKELDDFYDSVIEEPRLKVLSDIGKSGKTKVSQNVEEGGGVKDFREKVSQEIKAFLDSGTDFLKIYNPARFEVWKQDSKPFSGNASMVSMTPCQITQIISEVCLELVREAGITMKARLCLVYEEAHSLIPEWNAVVTEGDKLATSGTARAILQGRKFGMGCLLITQRTANVTKTILNQCNTIFAMRTFDDTGKEFLSNYIGRDYADTLPSLPERHAIFFGRASSCENPVLIKLNDRDNFRGLFRVKFPPPISNGSAENSPSKGAVEDVGAQVLAADSQDDVPF